MIDDAEHLIEPAVGGVAEALDHALSGKQPPTASTDRAARFDWDTVTMQAEGVYGRVGDIK